MNDIDEREYFYLSNYKELGRLRMNYGSYREPDPLLPIFKVIKEDDNRYILKAGHLTDDNVFHPQPIKIHYILIDNIILNIIQGPDYYGDKFSTELKLYNLNYSDSINVSLKELLSPQEIDEYINSLNLLIHHESGWEI